MMIFPIKNLFFVGPHFRPQIFRCLDRSPVLHLESPKRRPSLRATLTSKGLSAELGLFGLASAELTVGPDLHVVL